MEIAEVLVSLVHADGTAAVVRDREGEAWLMGSLEDRGATGLSDARPGLAGLTGDRTLVGGLLPSGAVAAEVVDVAGERIAAAASGGAWIAVLDEPADGRVAPVRFVDAAGASVAPALPAAWPRTAVDDAGEPCPACGACGWDEVVPLDASRGSRGSAGGAEEPTPVVVCRTCGHEEREGVWFHVDAGEDEDPVDAERRMRRWERKRRRQERAMLSRVPFPIYAAEGLSSSLGGWGGPSQRAPSRVTVSHAVEEGALLRVETLATTCVYESIPALVRRELADHAMAQSSEWPELSQAALTLWLRADERRGEQAAARATATEHAFAVDGRAVPFHVARSGEAWAAAAHHGETVIVITARGIEPEQVRLSAPWPADP